MKKEKKEIEETKKSSDENVVKKSTNPKAKKDVDKVVLDKEIVKTPSKNNETEEVKEVQNETKGKNKRVCEKICK